VKIKKKNYGTSFNLIAAACRPVRKFRPPWIIYKVAALRPDQFSPVPAHQYNFFTTWASRLPQFFLHHSQSQSTQSTWRQCASATVYTSTHFYNGGW